MRPWQVMVAIGAIETVQDDPLPLSFGPPWVRRPRPLPPAARHAAAWPGPARSPSMNGRLCTRLTADSAGAGLRCALQDAGPGGGRLLLPAHLPLLLCLPHLWLGRRALVARLHGCAAAGCFMGTLHGPLDCRLPGLPAPASAGRRRSACPCAPCRSAGEPHGDDGAGGQAMGAAAPPLLEPVRGPAPSCGGMRSTLPGAPLALLPATPRARHITPPLPLPPQEQRCGPRIPVPPRRGRLLGALRLGMGLPALCCIGHLHCQRPSLGAPCPAKHTAGLAATSITSLYAPPPCRPQQRSTTIPSSSPTGGAWTRSTRGCPAQALTVQQQTRGWRLVRSPAGAPRRARMPHAASRCCCRCRCRCHHHNHNHHHHHHHAGAGQTAAMGPTTTPSSTKILSSNQRAG
jgi:hypothetical protein